MGTTMGAQAQVKLADISTEKAYYFVSTTTDRSVKQEGAIYTDGTKLTYKKLDTSDNNFYWIIVPATDGGYYIYNVGTKTFWGHTTAIYTAWPVSKVTTAMDIKVGSTTENDVDSINIRPYGSSNSFYFAHLEARLNIINWYVETQTCSSYFTIMEATELDPTTLSEALSGVNDAVNLGNYLSEAASLLALENVVGGYTTAQLADLIAAYDNGNGSDTTALKTAIDAMEGQTRIAFDATKAYTISTKGRSASGWSMTGTANDTVTAGEVTDPDDTYKWLITQVEGITYLYNIGVGQFVGGPTDGIWTLSDTPAALGMELSDQNDPTIYYFGLNGQMSNRTSNDYFLYAAWTNNVVAWNAEASTTASMWFLTEAEVEHETLANAINASNAVAYLDAYKTVAAELLSLENVVGGYTTAQLATLRSVYADGNVTSATDLKSAIDAVKAIATADLVQFDATKAYTLNNIRYSGSALTAADGVASNKTLDESSDNFKWIVYTANDGKQYLYNIGTGSFLIYSNVEEKPWTVAADDASPFSVELVDGTKSMVAYCVGSYGNTSDKTNPNYFMRAKSANGNIVRWAASANASQWMLKPVETDATVLANAFAKAAEYVNNTVTIDALGYVSYCFPGAVDFTNSDVTAYVVSAMDATTATLTEVTGVLPAETGVILYCATPGSYTIPSATGTATVGTNLLVGTLKETTLAAGAAYVLAATEATDGVEFALLSDADAADGGNVVPANRAYLPVSEVSSGTSQQTLSFTFGTPTAIESATVESDEDVTWYTLGGVAVKNPSKGIYVNSKGKVVLFK